MAVVLGRRADHGRAADVDILDAVIERSALRHGRLEGVEIDRHQIDGRDVARRHGLAMGLAKRQDAAVYLGMKGLYPAVHDLGKAGVVGHLDDRDPGLSKRLGRASGGQDFNPAALKKAAEFGQTTLVGNGN